MFDVIKLQWYQNQGYRALRKGKHERASYNFERALLISESVEVRFNYIIVLSALGKYKEAYQHLKRVIEEYPDNEMALSMMIWVSMMLREWEMAIDYCDKIRLKFPSNHEFIHLHDIIKSPMVREKFISAHEKTKKAEQLILKKKHDEALSLLEEAIELNPDDAVIYNNIASIHLKKRDNKQAKTFMKKAIELDPTNDVYKKNLRIIIKKK